MQQNALPLNYLHKYINIHSKTELYLYWFSEVLRANNGGLLAKTCVDVLAVLQANSILLIYHVQNAVSCHPAGWLTQNLIAFLSLHKSIHPCTNVLPLVFYPTFGLLIPFFFSSSTPINYHPLFHVSIPLHGTVPFILLKTHSLFSTFPHLLLSTLFTPYPNLKAISYKDFKLHHSRTAIPHFTSIYMRNPYYSF